VGIEVVSLKELHRDRGEVVTLVRVVDGRQAVAETPEAKAKPAQKDDCKPDPCERNTLTRVLRNAHLDVAERRAIVAQ
jgi:hypothetical protein